MKRSTTMLVVAAATGLAIAAGLSLIYRNRGRVISRRFEPPDHELYIADHIGHSILGFEIGANGNITTRPHRLITGPNTGLHNPFGVALDSQKRIWVVSLGEPVASGEPPRVYPSITVYSPYANGNERPLWTIEMATNLFTFPFGLLSAIAIRRRPENALVVDSKVGSIDEYPMVYGNGHYTGNISGPNTEVINPTGIALDLSGRIYVARARAAVLGGLYPIPSILEDAILIFAVQANTMIDSAPTAMITGPSLANPAHICFDGRDQLYVVNRGLPVGTESTITVYAAGATGIATPIRVIRLANFAIPYGIAVDPLGRLYVSGFTQIRVYGPQANGWDAPDEVIQHQDLYGAIGLAVRHSSIETGTSMPHM